MTDQTNDTNVNPLTDLFALPEPYASDERSARWHAEIIKRMEREAAGLPMQTFQVQLMERIAFFYVVMRYREFYGDGDIIEPKALEAVNKPWLQMFDVFSRSIEKHKDQILRDTIIKIQGVIMEVLETVEDVETNKRLKREFVEAFAREGM